VEDNEVLAWLCRVTVPDRDLPPLPERLALACVAVTGADGAAITADYTGKDRITLFATDEVAGRLEDLQEVIGEGPGWDAHHGDDAVGGPLRDTTLWSSFVPAAVQELGPLWVYAAPIRAGGAQIGVLTLYWATTPNSGPDLSVVQFLADVVGAAFYRSPQDDLTGRAPWHTRTLIHDAANTVVTQLNITPQDAMVVLRAHAYSSSAPLHAIATKVVNQELTFNPTHATSSEGT
jgi:hypothetical protein